METAEILISTRVDKSLYAKILDRQKRAKKETGIEPSVSAIVRAMIGEAILNDEPKRRRHGTKRR